MTLINYRVHHLVLHKKALTLNYEETSKLNLNWNMLQRTFFALDIKIDLTNNLITELIRVNAKMEPR